MSTFVATTDPEDAPAAGVPCDEVLDLAGRDVPLGRWTVVRRYLPDRQLRTIGAWCFLDRIGPHAAADHPAMWVPPHPHIGLQTVTWLTDGEVLHRDGVGSRQRVRPGELGIMTSGEGIVHSEESPGDGPMALSGVQLWVALPEARRHGGPEYAYHADLPVLHGEGFTATVFVGGLGARGTLVRSPTRVHSPLLGAQLNLAPEATAELDLDRTFEHGLLVLEGELEADGRPVTAGTLLYLPTGHDRWALRAGPATRAVLIGGTPLADELVMWWNFVARDHDEITRARDDWEAARRAGGPGTPSLSRFAPVDGFPGDPLPAPGLPPVRLLPRDQRGRRAEG